jgi:UDP-N-acetylmuramoyl-L-alanyl-D-glutamate--2,6-diaminopimelate ligase
VPGSAGSNPATPPIGVRPRQVQPRPLAALAGLIGLEAPANPQVTGVTHASDAVRRGDLYAALPGSRRHGAEFVPAAAAVGAVAVLTDPQGAPAAAAAGLPALVVPDPREVLGAVASAVYGDPTRHLTVIGVTGTAGKTSTTYLVESGLRAAGRTPGLIGTVETRLGDLVLDSVRTTPEATDLHAMLAAARERGVDSVAMEVSSHALAMDRVGGVRFAVGGWTNFGLDHLDFHRDAEEYFAAKARLFDGRCAVEVLNLDEPALRPLIKPDTVTYAASGDPAATWRAVAVTGDAYAQRFTAIGPDGGVAAGVALPGRHNVANALLAIAALVAVGVEPAVAASGVAACPGVPGRMERVDAPGPVVGVVDYAHKPDAIVAVLAALRELITPPPHPGELITPPPRPGELTAERGGRLICVLGAGGDRDRGKRSPMGAAAARGADLVIVTDDNPRTEDPAAIRREVLAGAVQAGTGAEILEVAGRRAAIGQAVAMAAPGDVVAVLGKGHERGQEVAGEVHPFDDNHELAAALGGLASGVQR